MRYIAIDLSPQEFESKVRAFAREGGRGLNVTVPHKWAAHCLATSLSERARDAQAVNTLVMNGERSMHGDNTDGVGLLRDLTVNLGWSLAGKKLLMLGAGGAAAGVLGPLLGEDIAALVIANRTEARAKDLAARWQAAPIRGCGLDQLSQQGVFDVVINATSAALSGASLELPASMVGADTRAYDMMYAPRPTPFLTSMRAMGVSASSDGRGMLVEQAAESFFLWRGVRPQTASVIHRLSASLDADS